MTTKTKKTPQTNLQPAITELHKIYKKANEILFNNELPEDVVITIQSRGKRKGTLGWMYTKPVWEAGEDKELYEINIASEALKRDYFEIITTLIHEMVHVWNAVGEVKDTSRGNSYHNKRFLASAIEAGMEYTHERPHEKIGYSAVTLTKETQNKIKFWGINKEAFAVSRKDLNAGGQAKKKSNIIKWCCPSCDLIMRSSKPNVNVKCIDCDEQLQQAE
ncbi:hypothetical protein BKP35_10445 [Anaerobacillus arseniciselenatis]|uniref:SprT-like domain-containing protein n=1 Tax=Anaerobacillus arseniciselenatis TaxID=85682 RepID=A0A1S2LL79_9BACI|nr:SprT-like domain-containing protein [Anaerobacillus arseniciselenatis]OIJ12970.1 hypothetical protein BKP35_10445 [Anaerobacillus arseniciselenatis]